MVTLLKHKKKILIFWIYLPTFYYYRPSAFSRRNKQTSCDFNNHSTIHGTHNITYSSRDAYFLCPSVYTIYWRRAETDCYISILFRPNTPYNTAWDLFFIALFWGGEREEGDGDDGDDRDDDDGEKDEEELKIYTHVLAKLPYRSRIVYA